MVHYFDTVPTTMETASSLAADGRLGIWDSVLAREQTEGRGQLRRHWESPVGNLYASIRIPQGAPFDSSAAAVAVGVLCARGMAELGCEPRLKWPNDLALPVGSHMAKVGGILLEEYQGRLIAGIGINIIANPESLRPGAALGATSLQAACGGEWPAPRELWPNLVKNMLKVYKDAVFFAEHWRSMAEKLLLWRGASVEVVDDGEILKGVFRGLGSDGCALLAAAEGMIRVYGGSMRPAGQVVM